MIRFQTATPEDAPNLSKLVNSAYRGDYSKQGWTTEADLLDGQRTDAEALKNLIETPLNQIELLFEGRSEVISGSVHLVQELPDTLYFGMLTIEPSLQSKGLGKILLSHVEQVAKGYGFKKIRCTVIPARKELIEFYKRRGFRETGKFEVFPAHDPRFGIPKVSNLSLQEFVKVIEKEKPVNE